MVHNNRNLPVVVQPEWEDIEWEDMPRVSVNLLKRLLRKPVVQFLLLVAGIGVTAAASTESTPHNEAKAISLFSYDAPSKEEAKRQFEELKLRPEDLPTAEEDRPEPAPAGVKKLAITLAQQTKLYIRSYAAAAQASMRRYGVPASITLAQGLVEGRAGTSYLATVANNHFGMKCSSRHCKKGHCVNRTDDSHKDFFLKFPSVKACYDAHGKLLSQGRYKKLHRYGKNYRQWAYGLKAVGYATDRTYAEKLIGIIECYELYKYDK